MVKLSLTERDSLSGSYYIISSSGDGVYVNRHHSITKHFFYDHFLKNLFNIKGP